MRTTIALLFLLLASPIASADDAFYETRLATGKQAYTEKRMPEAVIDLRIAAFGFLDRPALLSETLVWLTLAESASGRPDMLRWALTRFVEVETRFHPYKQLALDAASRSSFEKILLATIAPDTIASIPTLSELVPRKTQVPSTAKPGTRQTAPADAVRVVPPPTKPAPPKGSTAKPAPPKVEPAKPASPKVNPPQTAPSPQPGAAIIPASTGTPTVPVNSGTAATPAKPAEAKPVAPQVPPAAPKPEASKPEAKPAVAAAPPTPAPVKKEESTKPASPVRSAEDLAAEKIEKGKSLLEQNKNEEALRILKDLVARTPSRTARKYLLHAATRTHNWQTAVVQVPLLEPFTLGEEVTMFYAAVALYQTGKMAEARPLLERSLPGINPSPYVDSYKQKILGQ